MGRDPFHCDDSLGPGISWMRKEEKWDETWRSALGMKDQPCPCWPCKAEASGQEREEGMEGEMKAEKDQCLC